MGDKDIGKIKGLLDTLSIREVFKMLFLVISNPHPSKPEDVKNARLEFRSWIKDLKSENKVVCFYPGVGRGSVVIFDVASNDELHKLMTQWSDIVPVSFDFYPLATPSKADNLLK